MFAFGQSPRLSTCWPVSSPCRSGALRLSSLLRFVHATDADCARSGPSPSSRLLSHAESECAPSLHSRLWGAHGRLLRTACQRLSTPRFKARCSTSRCAERFRPRHTQTDLFLTLSQSTVNGMVQRLRVFAAEVTRVAKEVGTDGQLGGQAVVHGVEGTWRELTVRPFPVPSALPPHTDVSLVL